MKKIIQLCTILMLIPVICFNGYIFAQSNFFPRGVFSVMSTRGLDNLAQVKRAGFNVIRAGKHIRPFQKILTRAPQHGLRVAFDGGKYIHNYSSAQYHQYQAGFPESYDRSIDRPERFYLFEHETGQAFTENELAGWYANPALHAPGYLLQGVRDPRRPDSKGIWYEQKINDNGTDFVASYRLRLGTRGMAKPTEPIVTLKISAWVVRAKVLSSFETLVDTSLYLHDFTIGNWDTFSVNYHLSSSKRERFVHHNLYWHGNKEILVGWVTVKDRKSCAVTRRFTFV